MADESEDLMQGDAGGDPNFRMTDAIYLYGAIEPNPTLIVREGRGDSMQPDGSLHTNIFLDCQTTRRLVTDFADSVKGLPAFADQQLLDDMLHLIDDLETNGPITIEHPQAQAGADLKEMFRNNFNDLRSFEPGGVLASIPTTPAQARVQSAEEGKPYVAMATLICGMPMM